MSPSVPSTPAPRPPDCDGESAWPGDPGLARCPTVVAAAASLMAKGCGGGDEGSPHNCGMRHGGACRGLHRHGWRSACAGRFACCARSASGGSGERPRRDHRRDAEDGHGCRLRHAAGWVTVGPAAALPRRPRPRQSPRQMTAPRAQFRLVTGRQRTMPRRPADPEECLRRRQDEPWTMTLLCVACGSGLGPGRGDV